jgi:hypothetical protein
MTQADLFSLHGKSAVVVGGGGVLAGAGAAIAIFDFHKENGEARAAAIRSKSPRT